MSGFGPYRIVRELGRGGMGSVHEVTHPEMPGRRLALKLIPITTGEVTRRRFAREAELLGRIRHPGVVQVHASGVAPEGPWLVMDLIDGKSLHAALREQGRYPGPRAGEVALGIAEAVAALHAGGLIHRDLKPGNVMLRSDGTPIVVDFGLAWAEDTQPLTRTGVLLGTPTWLAPEMLLGGAARHDPRVDVWGLGSILFALLVGHAPFADQDVQRILHEDPRWPAAPAPLLRVLKRSLSKEPARRQADARVFADELRQALSQGEKPVSRVVALVSLGAALIAVTAIATRPDREVVPARPTAPITTATALAPPPVVAPPSPRWQRLEHPGQPERAAGAFVPDGSGRFLTWAFTDASPGASELVEWRATPTGATPTGRRWDLEQEVWQVAFARTRAFILVGRTLLSLELAEPTPRPEVLSRPPFDHAVTALAAQADGRRCAIGFAGQDERVRVVAFGIDGGALRSETEHQLDGMRVTGLVLDPAGLTVAVNGPVALNRLVMFPVAGGSAGVPITTGPTLVTRDPAGGLWLGTESGFIHRWDPSSDLVEPQLEGVAAKSDLDAGGGLMRASSHSGSVIAMCFSAPLAFSASSDFTSRELRAWEGRGGEWTNVAGVARFPGQLWSLDVSPDGAWLLVGHGSALEVWAREALPRVRPDAPRLPSWEEVVAPLRGRR